MDSIPPRPAGIRRSRNFWRELRPEGEDRTALHRRARLLALGYTAVYAALYAVLLRPLTILTARWDAGLSAALHALLPPLFGTAVCALTWPLFRRERRMMAAAFRQIALAALVTFGIFQFFLWGDWEAQGLVAHFYAAFVLLPVVLGGGTGLLLYYWRWKKTL